MPILQIPYAYTTNQIPMSPEVAEKGQDFSCPLCDCEVVLRRGKVRRPHFAHKPDTGCSGEGVRHKVAKQMIYLMYLRSVRTVMVSVTTFRRCPNCSQGVLFSQTPKYDDVACEVDVGRHRVDIALFRNGKPTYGIEVQDTHPVDDEKWDAFAELQFPCIEVDSRDVIRMWEYDLKSWRQQLFLNISLFVEVNEIATWRQASTLVFAICVGCATKHNPICTLNHNFNITQHGRGGIDRMDYLTFIILHKKI